VSRASGAMEVFRGELDTVSYHRYTRLV